MKRIKPAKLRDRRSGQSPYARRKKVPYHYSAEYYQWKRKYVKESA